MARKISRIVDSLLETDPRRIIPGRLFFDYAKDVPAFDNTPDNRVTEIGISVPLEFIREFNLTNGRRFSLRLPFPQDVFEALRQPLKMRNPAPRVASERYSDFISAESEFQKYGGSYSCSWVPQGMAYLLRVREDFNLDIAENVQVGTLPISFRDGPVLVG